MVVDDIYAIVGSANINQRSMDGRRDTEIAMGCWETMPGTDNLVTDGHVQGLRKVKPPLPGLHEHSLPADITAVFHTLLIAYCSTFLVHV